MGTKANWKGNILQFYDTAYGYEHPARMAPVQFYDDFCGADAVIPASGSDESGCKWTKKIVLTAGTPTVAKVADAAGGVVQCALDATNEKQDALLHMDDLRNFDITKGLIFEARIKVTVTPTLLAEAYWGLIDDHSDGLIDSATYMAAFTADGATAVHAETDDNATDLDVDTGVTAGTTQWKVYRIDATVVTDLKFSIDGTEVCASTTFPYAATGANAILQPAIGLYKSTGAGVGTIQVDYVRIWQNR